MRIRFKYFVHISLKLNLLSILIVTVVVFSGLWMSNIDNFSAFISFKHRPMVRMAIINSVFYHGEIWYSHMYAAVIRSHWHVSLFTVSLPHSIHNENGLSYVTRSWSRLSPYS